MVNEDSTTSSVGSRITSGVGGSTDKVVDEQVDHAAINVARDLVDLTIRGVVFVALRIVQAYISIYLATSFVPGIVVDDTHALRGAVTTMAKLVIFVRPMAAVMLISAYAATLGLISIPVNGAMYLLVAQRVPGFHVADYRAAAVAGAIQATLSGITLLIRRRMPIDRVKERLTPSVARRLTRLRELLSLPRFRRGIATDKDDSGDTDGDVPEYL